MEHIIGWQLAGHLASVLTMVAYLLKDILWLRFLTILSCFAGMAFNYFVPATPLWTVIYWNVLFAVINIVQIAIIIKERSGVHFSEEEQELHETLFKNFAPFEFMKLMRIGKWLDARPGQVLAVEKQSLDSVMLIYNGLAGVEQNGKEVAKLKDGNFIGEVSFITEGVASATVRALEPTRYIAWPKTAIKALLNRNPSMRFAMQTMLSTDLSKKLMRRAPSFRGRISFASFLRRKKPDGPK
ncbi:MAG TPA: cyclic nucleotide-binding domain-containing protein [Pyrinomonadaceae bacterium]|nr:cyclic nucleotide-binding domain-containing protein [Pyrinomonadaceae bacterium]